MRPEKICGSLEDSKAVFIPVLCSSLLSDDLTAEYPIACRNASSGSSADAVRGSRHVELSGHKQQLSSSNGCTEHVPIPACVPWA